jgi:ribonuclease BN (tRNA processing enzyme)
MKIKVLGCYGSESPGHNTSSFLLDGKILFDAGSLTSVLSAGEQWKIENIFITHAHLDHIKGIPFFADNIITKNRRHKVNIISVPSVIKSLSRNLLNGSIWPDFTRIPTPADGVLRFIRLKTGRAIELDKYSVVPYKVNHSVPAVGYLVVSSMNKRFFYTGDTGPTGDTWKKIGDVPIDCLIIETSFPNRMKELAITTGHLTPRLLKREIRQMERMPERILVTHPKPQYRNTIEKELDGLNIPNLRLLNDGETINI